MGLEVLDKNYMTFNIITNKPMFLSICFQYTNLKVNNILTSEFDYIVAYSHI